MLDKLAESARRGQQSFIREVTKRCSETGAMNLGQGNCALPPSPRLLDAASRAMKEGHNSYTFFNGIKSLRRALAHRYRSYNGLDVTEDNMLVTGGATGGLEIICKSFLEKGDEVAIFEPTYQYHVTQVLERDARVRYIKLHPPDWKFSTDEFARAITPATKLLIFSNPHNPTGKVFSRGELEAIAETCLETGTIAVVDEVYEYILHGPCRHLSLASLPKMFEQTLTISSASKTFFVTGWRVGWVIGPKSILEPLGIKSDATYVCAPAPFQYAIRAGLEFDDNFFGDIRRLFTENRNKLLHALEQAGFRVYPPDGAYYVLADYEKLGFSNDMEAMKELIAVKRIGAVPGKAFYAKQRDSRLLRFSFALEKSGVERACQLLLRSL